ncbi:hypothetical protein ACFQRB_14245 [Halobaculum litoreum]|uniref:Uncharacterized protein n=1 Tax=Halobaculum litoreum TaxID=3031998 RepID=A0ABD5XRR9_9EURY
MSNQYDEQAFETHIESQLLDRGYEQIHKSNFDAERGIFPGVVVSFVQETQPDQWAKLENAYKGKAEERFLRELTSAQRITAPFTSSATASEPPAPASISRTSNRTRGRTPRCSAATRRTSWV